MVMYRTCAPLNMNRLASCVPTIQAYPETKVRVGSIYRHYKFALAPGSPEVTTTTHDYRVVTLARHCSTLTPYVVYQSVNDPQLTWIRPLSSFEEDVVVNSDPPVPRFSPV